MKKEVDYDILQGLNDDDVEVICQNVDLDVLLHPIKHNAKKYNRYTRLLGRMDKKSLLAQKNMPKIATELYHKGDNAYYQIVAIEAMELKHIFIKIIKNELKVSITLKDLANYSIEEYISLFTQIEKIHGNSIDVQLFVLQSKMNGIVIDKEKQIILTDQWKYHCKFKQLEDDFQLEKENLIKEHKSNTNSQLKKQRAHYETLILEKEDNENQLREFIKNKENGNFELEKEITVYKSEISDLKMDKLQNIEFIKSLQKESLNLSKTIEGLKKNISEQNDKYRIELRKEWESSNLLLLKENEELESKVLELKKELEELTQKKKELLISLESVQDLMDSCTVDFKNQMVNQLVTKTVEEVNQTNIPIQSFQSSSFSEQSELYIIDGSKVAEHCMLDDNEKFLDIIESNLENAGCKMRATELIDNINATINSNLIPLLCGFGTRKLAFAFIAARYAENPTVISIPNGFTSIRQLEVAINSAPTNCIIIEDAFGKMSENIVLPILRNNLKKQLIFCCEDLHNLKYLDNYYYNYFQLIQVSRMGNYKLIDLKYAKAEDLFKRIEYDNKAIGHQLVRYLVDEIDLSDTYKITRGNMLTYKIQELSYDKEKAVHKWIKKELHYLLTNEQEEKIFEKIENNDSIFKE
ncbi:hypothetical protein [Fusibacter sp. 3D3]|uniref:hypothetical protein n=1 Tax=Fusibacter sp. 3D3 TaxID=1048380 RepID=UPI0008528F1D|nr:hypothetical protein [Fusibacter sp. 3D3]GAU78661.1 hypothetical protein F3D3_3296 [Fusibacter sp. 3D3]